MKPNVAIVRDERKKGGSRRNARAQRKPRSALFRLTSIMKSKTLREHPTDRAREFSAAERPAAMLSCRRFGAQRALGFRAVKNDAGDFQQTAVPSARPFLLTRPVI